MAVTLTNDLTTWDAADASTNWVARGNASTMALNQDLQIEGTGCVTSKVTVAGLAGVMSPAAGADFNITTLHLFVWQNCLLPVDTRANGGLRVRVEGTAGSNTQDYGEWYVGGKDTYKGGWQMSVVDGNRKFDRTEMDISATFVNGTPDTITRAAGSWVTDEFVAGGSIVTTGTTLNNRTFTIASVTAGTLTLTSNGVNVNEGPVTANFAGAIKGDISRTAIRRIGHMVNLTFAAMALQQPMFIDAIRYGTKLTVKGGTAGDRGTWQQIVDADEAGSVTGIVTKRSGVFIVSGKLEFGDDTGTADSYFKDTGQTVFFADQLVASTFYGIQIMGNATGTNSFQLGNVVGSGDARQGVSGGVIQALRSTAPFTFDSETDTAQINEMNLYGVTLRGAGIIRMSGSTTQDTISCIFDNCDEVQPNNAEFLNNTIIGPTRTDNGLEMISTHQIKQINFIAETGGATEHHLHIPAAGTYTADALKFFGFAPDGSPDWHGKNDSGGAVTINATNNATIAQAEVENVGGGSTTTVINTKTLTVTVKDSSNNFIQGAQVWIQKDPADTDFGHEAKPFTSAAGNNAGDADFVVSEAIPSDLPSSGWINVTSSGRLQSYRYASKSGSTFTLRTGVTGTDNGSGTTTTISETGISAKDIVEGDTIRMTASPKEWAIVLSNTGDVVTTTATSGGTSWASKAYGVHTLAMTYQQTTDKATVPLMNEETNASGVATESYNFGSSKAVIIRIRKATSGTKYIPYSTTGTITGDFNLEATLTTDTIA